jgi:hypothetical protein
MTRWSYMCGLSSGFMLGTFLLTPPFTPFSWFILAGMVVSFADDYCSWRRKHLQNLSSTGEAS